MVTGIVTYLATRKSQINKNTEAIEKLISKIGIDDGMNLKMSYDTIKISFDTVMSDIGRAEEMNLTKQHKSIKDEISNSFNKVENNFSKIEKRNNDEDSRYSLLNKEQRDIHDTMRAFVADYQRSNAEIANYLKQVEEGNSQIEDLNKQISKLNKEISSLRSENKLLREIRPTKDTYNSQDKSLPSFTKEEEEADEQDWELEI